MILSILKKRCHILLLLISSFIRSSDAQNNINDDIYKSAVEKGRLIADYWVKRSGINASSTDYYADICSYYGACILGDAMGDSSIFMEINSRYKRTEPIRTNNIDENSCGILPLHLYLHTKNDQQLNLGINAAVANIQKKGHARNAIDDTYMTGSLLVQAYRATNDTKYLDFCAEYLTTYMKNLQQSNGLYWHHGDISKQFWGRGNGWGAAAAAELIQVLPKDHARYKNVLDGYKKQMQGLISAQLKSGMWPQLLGSTSSRNWEETSGTSMFLFAIFTGLELGLLDKETFFEPAKKGWMALVDYVGSDGKLNNIAAGFWPGVGNADEYLNANKASAGNSHGTAGILWAATAIIRYYHSGAITGQRMVYTQQPYLVAGKNQTHYIDLNGRLFNFSLQKASLQASKVIYTNKENTTRCIINLNP